MADKDKADQLLLSNRRNFSCFLNGYLFGGKQVLSEEDIEDLPEEYSGLTGSRFMRGTKDVFKKVHLPNRLDSEIVVVCMVDAEIMAQPDTYIVFRIMLYEALAYKYMIDNHLPLIRVHPIVLNYSTERFTRPKSKKELTQEDYWPFDEPDYWVNQIDVATMEEEELARYAGDIGGFFQFLHANYVKQMPWENNHRTIENPELFLNAVAAHSKDAFSKVIYETLKKGAEKTMIFDYICDTYENEVNKARAEGKFETLLASCLKLADKKGFTFKEAADLLADNEEDKNIVMKMYDGN